MPSKYNPSLYYHVRDDIKVLVHGDDFVAAGERGRVARFKEQLAKRFTIKSKIVGSGAPPVVRSHAASGGEGNGLQGCR